MWPPTQRRCRVLIGMADGMRVSDRQTQALEILGNAQQIAEENGYDHYLAGIHYLRGNLYFPLGNIEGCLEEHTKALAAARRVSSPEDEALALGGLGDAYYLQGLMQSSFDQFRSCVELSQSRGYARIEAANRHMVGWTRIHQMEFAQARADAAVTLELARQISHRRAEILALMLTCIIDLCTARRRCLRGKCRRVLSILPGAPKPAISRPKCSRHGAATTRCWAGTTKPWNWSTRRWR